MRRKRKILILVAAILIVFGLLSYYLSNNSVPVLSPSGLVATKQKQLMILALALAAIVVLPVYSLTIIIALKYRETNRKAKYDPDWDHSRVLETIWWLVPMAIILVLSVITWKSSHSLNPYKPLASSGKTLNVEVVALDWKWLFIYPQQGVASVNRLEMPVSTPVHFYITSDTVMNSFWIPALAGQIYAMPGMTTQLNLEANKIGTFAGSSANISGEGFAGMTFSAVSAPLYKFNEWLAQAKSSTNSLSVAMYQQLARPSQYNPVAYYKQPVNGLFNAIINRYMMPNQSLASGVQM